MVGVSRFFIFAVLGLLTACGPVPSQTQRKASSDNLSLLSRPQAKNLSQVTPKNSVQLPEDHGAHPDFAIEWWYLTANLRDQQGKAYGLQWTLFRFNNGESATPWSDGQQYMAHAKFSSASDNWFSERFARGGVGNAGVESSPFSLFLDDWQWQSGGTSPFPASLNFRFDDVDIRLDMSANKPYILHGQAGFSRKQQNESLASYYYSQPFVELSGEITLDGQQIRVSGQGWFDHEWTSALMDSQTSGWDWFALHLDSGDKLMLFRMRHQQLDDFWSGTWITRDGISQQLSHDQVQAKVIGHSDVAGRQLPLMWHIRVPDYQIDIQLAPMNSNQWNPGRFAYYEGAVNFSGTHEGQGFIELTGY